MSNHMISDEGENLVEETLEITQVFSGDLLELTVNTVRSASGSKAKREVVHHPGGVVILPVLSGDQGEEVLLVRQYREPAGKPLWELPAGTLEEGETEKECARRELIEETKYSSSNLEKKVELFTSPGYTDEILTLYLATGLEKLGPSEEVETPEDENLIVESFPTEELIEMARKGKITDGKTLAGLFFLTH
ncbi:MAG: NUDIX hydrolase [Candidatus Bipolaricaulota bacterium]